jgi:hypothetical protein
MRFAVCEDLRTDYFDSVESVAPTGGRKTWNNNVWWRAVPSTRISRDKTFATFDGMSQGTTNGLSAIVKQLY